MCIRDSGGRGSTSTTAVTPAVTRSVSRIPNAKTLSELRRISYAFTAKGEVPDVAHRDGSFGFTEYAYAVGTSQPDVPRTIQEARASPEAAEWTAAAEREIESLKERKVYKLVPRTAVPPGRKRIKSKWVFKRKAASRGVSWHKVGTKCLDSTAAAPSLRCVDSPASG